MKDDMPAIRFLATLLFVSALPLHAQEIDLSSKIASGKWALTYQRTGEFRPLHIKQKENGTSYTCIAGNARQMIVDWVAGKGCTIDREAMVNGVYRLEGQCRLKWWKNHPIPVKVELRPESATRFSLDIKTSKDSVLGFTERTSAILQGPCDPPSATKPVQNQGPKG